MLTICFCLKHAKEGSKIQIKCMLLTRDHDMGGEPGLPWAQCHRGDFGVGSQRQKRESEMAA